MFTSPISVTSLLAIHMAAFVFKSAEPMLMPMPNSTSVPQETFACASFQVMMLMPGMNIRVIAMTVEAVVETGCRIFSVTQKKINRREMIRSFFSFGLMEPISSMAFLTVSSPPFTSLISAGSIFMQTKYRITDIIAA